MKIVLVTNILSPYRKVFFDKLYHCFQKNETEFYVLVMAQSEPSRHWYYEEYKGEYSELLETKTIQVHNICFHFNRNIQKRLQEINPDIVVASGHYLSPSVFKVIGLKHKLHYKLLFWSESHLDETRNYHTMKLKLRELIRSYTYKKFDGYWYAGDKSRQFIEKYDKRNGKRKKDYYFIPNLVDNNYYNTGIEEDEKLRIRREYQIPKEQYLFVLPARLEEEKGIIPFLSLYHNCQLKHKATIIIMGDGSLREEIETLIHTYDLNVKLVGYLEQDKIRELYSIGDCFLLPSISDANPLSCVEALWSGLPLLLSSHVGNYPETIHQGENGYVFNYDNQVEASHLIDQLIASNKQWRNGARQMSLRIAKEIYEPDQMVTSLVTKILNDYQRESTSYPKE